MEQEKSINNKKTLILVISMIVSFFIMGLTFILCFVWYVPDKFGELNKIVIETDKRLNDIKLIPPENNGWIHYKRAMDILDLKDIDTKSYKSNNTPPCPLCFKSSLNPISSASDIPDKLSVLNCFLSVDDFNLVSNVNLINKKALEEVDKGFSCKEFFYPDYLENLKNGNFCIITIDEINKVRTLEYFLLVSGDMEFIKENYMEAAKRYLEEIFLESSLDHLIATGNLGIVPRPPVTQHLSHLIRAAGDNPKVIKYINSELRKIPEYSFDNDIKLHYYVINKIASFAKSKYTQDTQNSWKLQKMILNRENKIIYLTIFDMIKAYNENPLRFPGNLNTDFRKKYSSSFISSRDSILMHYPYFKAYKTNQSGLKILAALEYYKSVKGIYPQKLEELVPDFLPSLPIDLYAKDGKFKYFTGNNRSTFYSVGPDGLDDNANTVATNPHDTNAKGDIIFSKPER
jgi:hypothetical protein